MKGIMKKAVFLAAAGMTALALSGCSAGSGGKRIVRISHAQSETHPEHLGLFTLQAEQLRTEHRRQRQSRNGGYKHNGAHHPAQLLEQHAGHTGYHSQREEYGNHRQCRSHYGNSHLVRSVNRCLLRVGTALDMCRDILQHHNGIVHHHTDGYGE